MFANLVLGTRVPTTQESGENLIIKELERKRLEIKELVNSLLGHQAIPTPSDRDIFIFMHQLEEHNGAEIPFEDQQKIWGAFQEYWGLYCVYSEQIKGETVESTKDALRAIDPSLIGESQWNEGDLWVVQMVKSFFYSISKWMVGEDLIDCYRGRLTVLEPQEMRESETEKVLQVFSEVFPSTSVSSLKEMNRYLDASEDCEQVQLFEDRLVTHYDGLSIHYLQNRPLSGPHEGFTYEPVSEIDMHSETSFQLIDEEREVEEEFTYDFTYEPVGGESSSPALVAKDRELDRIQEEEVPVLRPHPPINWRVLVGLIDSPFFSENFKEEDVREIKNLGNLTFEITFNNGTVLIAEKTRDDKLRLSGTALPAFMQNQFDKALGRKPENIFPFDKIQSVTILSEGSNPKLKIDFGQKVEGMIDAIPSGGWEDMQYHRLVIGPTLVAQFPEEGGIEFEEGNIQMGLHIENFSSLLGIVGLGSATSWTVSNLLYQGGFTDWHGKGKKGLDFAVKIDRMTADKSGKVCLTISLPPPDQMVKPRGNTKSPIEVIDLSTTETGASWVRKFLGSFSFSREEYEHSFAAVRWKELEG